MVLLQFEDRSGVSTTQIERAINNFLNDNPGFGVVEATIRLQQVTPGYSYGNGSQEANVPQPTSRPSTVSGNLRIRDSDRAGFTGGLAPQAATAVG